MESSELEAFSFQSTFCVKYDSQTLKSTKMKSVAVFLAVVAMAYAKPNVATVLSAPQVVSSIAQTPGTSHIVTSPAAAVATVNSVPVQWGSWPAVRSAQWAVPAATTWNAGIPAATTWSAAAPASWAWNTNWAGAPSVWGSTVVV